MPRFKHATQKYDENGNKIPKGRNGLKDYLICNQDCQVFDSKSEYDIYHLFKDMEKQGLIQNLECKKVFPLIPKTIWYNNVKEKKEAVRELVYISDFCFERDGQKVVVDCKGWKLKPDKKTGRPKYQVYYDDIYKIKKKLFLWLYQDYLFEEM